MRVCAGYTQRSPCREEVVPLAANPKRATKTVTGMLLEANWKDNTARIYPDEGEPVQVAFPEELADEIHRAARHRVRVTGNLRRPRNGRQRIEVADVAIADGVEAARALLREVLASAGPAEPNRDPFEGAKPIENVETFLAGFPDERSAEEIIADMEACEVWHYPPYDDEED